MLMIGIWVEFILNSHKIEIVFNQRYHLNQMFSSSITKNLVSILMTLSYTFALFGCLCRLSSLSPPPLLINWTSNKFCPFNKCFSAIDNSLNKVSRTFSNTSASV